MPRRLTFLTTARTVPSDLFSDQWADGDQWRDWFDSDEIEVSSLEPEDLEQIDQRLAELYADWNRTLYRQLLNVDLSVDASMHELAEHLIWMDTDKAMIVAYLRLFEPELLAEHTELRASLLGADGLPDRQMVLSQQNTGNSIDELFELISERTRQTRRVWADSSRLERVKSSTDPMIANTLMLLRKLESAYPQK